MSLRSLFLISGLVLAAAPRAARADDLDDAVFTERTHRAENATAATVTAGVLGYDSFRLIYDTATGPSGHDGLVDFSLFRNAAYVVGGLAGVGSISMIALGVHDLTFTPVHDKSSRLQLGVASAEAHQCFGTYAGTVVPNGGEAIPIENLFGWAEEARWRW